MKNSVCVFGLLVALLAPPVASQDLEHGEYEASLHTAFKAVGGRWPITAAFAYPASVEHARWRVEVVSPSGQVIHREESTTPLRGGSGKMATQWNGRDDSGASVPAGYYTVRLRAFTETGGVREEVHDVLVGSTPRPRNLPVSQPLMVGVRHAGQQRGFRLRRAAPAPNALPYTIYYGNLHSQTNHSDGGTAVNHCTHAETPGQGEKGPLDAFDMMRTRADGDFLLTSEHNHMYDGSTRVDESTDPRDAIALFRQGLKAASDYRRDHPDFLSLYGLEWGVIGGGGHLNLINPDALANWEHNASNELIGSVETPHKDYAALYRTMRERGWIGQFNHPDNDQFVIGGDPLAFDENGAEVMVLAEVLNTSAFSKATTQPVDATRKSFWKQWNTLLERGYRVAPASNQDNHCANWGLSSTNRTGVLIRSDLALSRTNFVNALKARRVFATEDKDGQLVMTANGKVMGESFENTGALTLNLFHANTHGQRVQRVQFFEGVPGRNGEVEAMDADGGTLTFTPDPGEHFYYVVVTQDDGLRLWSAPVWVTQN
jgi:hypothetical protein